MELLKTIVFVFCKFCMSIYAEVLFTATEVQLTTELSFHLMQYRLSLL